MIIGAILLMGPRNVAGYFLKESRMQASIITAIGDIVLQCLLLLTLNSDCRRPVGVQRSSSSRSDGRDIRSHESLRVRLPSSSQSLS
jgi:hypothetical protein